MFRFRASLWVCLAVITGLTALVPSQARAQVAPGIQGGLSLDPDQVYFGGHIETTPLVDRLRFRPSVDIGIGDDLTVAAFNFDFTYTFPGRQGWNFYVGAGPSINWYNADNGGDATEGGFNFLLGAKQAGGLFFEMKVGMADSPDLKFGVGYTFR
jgi:hypothetical protein